MSDRRSLVLEISMKVDGAVAGFKKLEDARKEYTAKGADFVNKNKDSINTVANGAGILGAAMLGTAAMAVKSFADFDKGMSAVQAATHESAENMALLRDAAIEAGAKTIFNAQESAAAIEELAKAGVETSDILGGGLDGALDLAAAGSLGVADAAEIAATAMTQFKLSGTDVPHIADLLAAGAGKAQGSVQDLSMALKQSGLVANQVGLSIEETTGGLSAFASAGLIGSDAGTSFKSMLQRLTPQSKEAQNAMDDLGISAYDSQGNFIGLAAFAGNLQDSMKDLTAEQRNAAMATIFGSDAVRAANVLYEQGAGGVQEWINKVNDTGYASETAALMTDNLSGDIEQLGGAFETLMIKSGEGANGPLRSVVQTLTGLIEAVTGLPDPVKQGGVMLAGLGGASLLGMAGLSKLAISISETKDALANLATSAPKAATALKNVGTGASTLAIALAVAVVSAQAWDAIVEKMDRENGTGFQGSLSETSDLLEAFVENSKAAASGLSNVSYSLNEVDAVFAGSSTWMDSLNSMLGGSVDAVNSFGSAMQKLDENLIAPNWFSGDWRRAKEGMESIDQALVQMVQSGHGEDAALVYEDLTAKAADAGFTADQLATDYLPNYNEAVKAAAKEAELAAEKEEEHAAALGVTTTAAERAGMSVDDYSKAVGEWIKVGDQFGGIVDAYNDVLQANQDAARKSAEANKLSQDATEKAVAAATVSLDEWAAKLRDQGAALMDWGKNTMTAVGQGAPQAFINELAKQGPAGAEALKKFVEGTPAQRQSIIDAWQLTGGETGSAVKRGVADAMTDPRYQKILTGAMSQLGQDSFNAFSSELLAGTTDIETLMVKYGVIVESTDPEVQIQIDQALSDIQGAESELATLDASSADPAVQARIGELQAKVSEAKGLLNSLQDRVVTIKANVESADRITLADGRTVPKHKDGGLIRGPGTGTSDSILSWLSNGEYVVRESSARKYAGLLNAINADMLPGYANGGLVSTATLASVATIPQQTINLAQQDSQPGYRVYVENPITGEYVEGRLVSIAKDIVNAANSSTARSVAGSRRSGVN